MLLLIGPPGSGKTSFCLDRLREHLRAAEGDARLLVPTTTMAEHLRNQLAREGLVFPPRAVSTFAKYVNDIVADLPAARPATLEILCGETLEHLTLSRYAEVRDLPGFRSAAVRAIEEFAGAGGVVGHLVAAGAEPDFIELYSAVLEEVKRRSLFLRHERLAIAAGRVRNGSHRGIVLVCGFFTFTPPEIEILKALDAKADLVVALPDSPASTTAMESLRSAAAEIRKVPEPVHHAERVLFIAPTLDAEAVEIARRIAAEHATGRPFRDMGVIVRSEMPCVPALRTAFERFGIPARFYFAPALESDPLIRFFGAIVGACLSGWDHERTLLALRMAGSPLEHSFRGDSFDHRVRERLPGAGLPGLRELAPESAHEYLDELAKLSEWRTSEVAPATWACRFAQLPVLFCRPPLHDRATHDRAMIWRAQASAIEHFRDCVNEAAAALDPDSAIRCGDFWNAVRTVLASGTLRIVDRRRNVVHVIDAVEARQWRLPVVFVCGLLENQFPKHHSEDPILPDGIRLRLQGNGLPVRTSSDKQSDERFLFDQALTRATMRLHLSYSQLNAKGEPNLASFFLERARPFAIEPVVRAKPRPIRERAPESHAAIYSETLREELGRRLRKISPSRIASYLQCPFGMFACDILCLQEAPCDPWDRLDIAAQGSIAHEAFERHFRDDVPIAGAFDEAFSRACADQCVPAGYRTEAIRLELLYSVELMVRKNILPKWTQSLYEHSFEVPLTDDLTLRGQIDRVEIDAHGNALVIDYKYQNETRLKDTVAKHEEHKAVQAGAYLLAAEKLGYNPVGMVFCGFRENYTVRGWVRPSFAPELKTGSSEAQFHDLITSAREVAVATVGSIRDGRIAPVPEDDTRCWRCSYLKICRVDAQPARRAEVGGAD